MRLMTGSCFDQLRFAYLLGKARRKDLGSPVIQMETIAVQIPGKLAGRRQYPDRKASLLPHSLDLARMVFSLGRWHQQNNLDSIRLREFTQLGQALLCPAEQQLRIAHMRTMIRDASGQLAKIGHQQN